VKGWFAVLAPAGTPRSVVDRLSTEIAKIVAAPDMKEKLESQGQNPFLRTPEQLATLLRTDMARYAKIIKTANIRADQ